MGAATDFTVQYLDALKDILHADGAEEGMPRFDPRQINSFTIRRLQEAIRDLYVSSLADSGVRDVRTPVSRKSHERGKIRTTAIGYTDDFNMLVKMGFMLGDQVVFWDAILTKMIFRIQDCGIESFLSQCKKILSLYPIAKSGGIVYLPHPARWSDEYKRRYSLIRDIPGLTTDYLGLITAESLAEEKYVLNPYAIGQQPEELYELHKILDGRPANKEKLDKRESLRRFMRCGAVYALRQVSPAGFFEVLKKAETASRDRGSDMYQQDWKKQLLDYLSYDNSDDIPEIREAKREQMLDALDKLITQQSEILSEESKRHLSGAVGNAGYVSDTVGLVAIVLGAAVPGNLIKLLGKAFDGYPRLRDSLGSKLAPARNELVFQLFYDFDEQWSKELMEE